jgi:N-methylhydantoinase A/oxoprolinase/acetone carboxylase beta subunit
VVRSWPNPQDHAGLTEALTLLAKEADALVGPGAEATTVETAVDCRYRGQSHELTVPSVGEFHDEHRRRNGYARPEEPVEVVALRAVATRPPTVAAGDLPAAPRFAGEVRGPSVIAEPDCTIWVAGGWVAQAGADGALLMQRVLRT